MRWVDSKPLFRVKVRLVSSIFTTSTALHNFFQACDRLEKAGLSGDAAIKSEVSTARIKHCFTTVSASSHLVVPHFPLSCSRHFPACA